MSVTKINTFLECLRESRKQAKYVSRNTASADLPMSPETIGRHERGEVRVTPEDVIIYAKGYDSPDLLLRYCNECPIGVLIRPKLNDKDLPWATLRISQRLQKAADIACLLENIADDGVITVDELPDVEKVFLFLKDVEAASGELQLYLLSQGILPQKKTRSARNRIGSR